MTIEGIDDVFQGIAGEAITMNGRPMTARSSFVSMCMGYKTDPNSAMHVLELGLKIQKAQGGSVDLSDAEINLLRTIVVENPTGLFAPALAMTYRKLMPGATPTS